MSNKTAARIAVRDTLQELIVLNRDFRLSVLEDERLPAWVMKEQPDHTAKTDDDDTMDDRQRAVDAATSLTYKESQHRQETIRLPGLIGISSETLNIARSLNRARDDFKAAMTTYRKLFGDSIQVIEETSEELRDGLLGGLNIQHIHFVQCYRHLKLFETPPKRVGFSWAASHSGTVRLTAEEAIEHLKNKYLASSAITQDIKVLETMKPMETVVIKRILAPHLRANLTWSKTIMAMKQKDPSLKKQFPAQINTPLPLFVRLAPGIPLPEFNHIRPFDPTTRQERLTRSDARLVKISQNPHSRIYRTI